MAKSKSLKLFRISQSENNGYDTYDSAVVCAEDETEARNIRPDAGEWGKSRHGDVWSSTPENVKVEHLGTAAKGIEKGVIVASFNAG